MHIIAVSCHPSGPSAPSAPSGPSGSSGSSGPSGPSGSSGSLSGVSAAQTQHTGEHTEPPPVENIFTDCFQSLGLDEQKLTHIHQFL